MSQDNDPTTDEGHRDTTAGLRADFLGLDPSATAGAKAGLWEVDGLPGGAALVVVKRGPNAGSRFVLDQLVTLAGRHPRSDIFLDDLSVSRRHAEFRREHGDFRIVDVGSLNSTYVNGEPVDSSAVLANGDQIQIGKFCLVFFTTPHHELTNLGN
ncbi:MAG: FHA domain-containing protein [Mycolicibacterium sp.]|nr:FHA domain-containing protein [Mycolicibacterium sp.]